MMTITVTEQQLNMLNMALIIYSHQLHNAATSLTVSDQNANQQQIKSYNLRAIEARQFAQSIQQEGALNNG